MNVCLTWSCLWCSPAKGLFHEQVLCRTKMTLNIRMYFKLGLTRGVLRKGLFHEQA